MMSSEALALTPLCRAQDYPCPTCSVPADEPCVNVRSREPLKTDRNHQRREDLLWSQPCPECGVGVGVYCTGRQEGVNHYARDVAIHAAVPGSMAPTPPVEKVSYREASRRAERDVDEAVSRLRQLAAEGRAPWQVARP